MVNSMDMEETLRARKECSRVIKRKTSTKFVLFSPRHTPHHTVPMLEYILQKVIFIRDWLFGFVPSSPRGCNLKS